MSNLEQPLCRHLTDFGECVGKDMAGIRRAQAPLRIDYSSLGGTQELAIQGQTWSCLLAGNPDLQPYCSGYEAKQVIPAVKAVEVLEKFG